jgi:hypothetical protein
MNDTITTVIGSTGTIEVLNAVPDSFLAQKLQIIIFILALLKLMFEHYNSEKKKKEDEQRDTKKDN